MLIKQIRKTLHGFCDASNEAYTAIVYLQIDSDNGTFINLFTAKKKKKKKKIFQNRTHQFHASDYYRVCCYQNTFVKHFVGLTLKWRYDGISRSVRFGRFGFQIGCV